MASRLSQPVNNEELLHASTSDFAWVLIIPWEKRTAKLNEFPVLAGISMAAVGLHPFSM